MNGHILNFFFFWKMASIYLTDGFDVNCEMKTPRLVPIWGLNNWKKGERLDLKVEIRS